MNARIVSSLIIGIGLSAVALAIWLTERSGRFVYVKEGDTAGVLDTKIGLLYFLNTQNKQWMEINPRTGAVRTISSGQQ